MTVAEIYEMIGSTGIECAYREFPEGSGQEPPFICFTMPGGDDLFADNENYVKISRLVIELYTDERDFALENTVEEMLKENNLTYTWDEDYIDTEHMHVTVYETEVLVDA